MFAQRLASVAPSATLKAAAEAERLRRAGHKVVDFTAGEPDFPTPEHVKAAGKAAIDANFTRYTPAAGIPELREAICSRYKGQYGVDITAAEVLMTAGGKQALFNTIFSLFGPGDQVICPVPYWTTYPELVELARAKPLFVEGEESRSYKVTAEELERSYTPEVKGLIINSPSNPSGAVYSLDELRELAEWATERDVWIISDEIYRKIYFPSAVAPGIFDLPEELTQKVVLVDGASKAFAMTGWRIGFTYSSKVLAEKFAALQSQTTSNASAPAQYAALAAYQGGEVAHAAVEKMRLAFKARRDLLAQLFAEKLPGVRYVSPEGAFYLFFSIERFARPGEGSIAFCERILSEAGVGLIPGVAFGQDDMARMSFAYSEDTLRAAVERLSKAL